MIGDDIAAALQGLRREAESLMRDCATLERADGYDLDPDNDERVTRWVRVLDTRVRVVRVGVASHDVATGGQVLDQATVELRAPWNLHDLRVGDRLTLSTCAGDPRLVGVPVTVTQVEHATDGVARRLRGVLDEDRRL